MKMMQTTSIATAKEIVLSAIDSLNREDFDAAVEHFAEDMTFEGVMGSRDGIDAYFDDMRKMKLKYKIRKVFEEGDDVCVLSDLQLPEGAIFCCSWYVIENGKVKTLRVVFDPRPLLKGTGPRTGPGL